MEYSFLENLFLVFGSCIGVFVFVYMLLNKEQPGDAEAFFYRMKMEHEERVRALHFKREKSMRGKPYSHKTLENTMENKR